MKESYLQVNIETNFATKNNKLTFFVQISILLERILGKAYSPEEHWTSKLRRRSGYSLFEAAEGQHSSFTLPDGQGKFTEWLVKVGHEDATGWFNSPPVYHLEVKTTAGNATSDFALTNAEFERVRHNASCFDTFFLDFAR